MRELTALSSPEFLNMLFDFSFIRCIFSSSLKQVSGAVFCHNCPAWATNKNEVIATRWNKRMKKLQDLCCCNVVSPWESFITRSRAEPQDHHSVIARHFWGGNLRSGFFLKEVPLLENNLSSRAGWIFLYNPIFSLEWNGSKLLLYKTCRKKAAMKFRGKILFDTFKVTSCWQRIQILRTFAFTDGCVSNEELGSLGDV